MKLYTITATPVRNRRQLSASELRSGESLDTINARALEVYPSTVATVLGKYGIDGFTIYPVKGYWKGVAEDSFKIEIAMGPEFHFIGDICRDLRDAFAQEAVMLTSGNGDVEFI